MKEIFLTRGLFAQVDDGDYEYLNTFSWQVHKESNTFYAVRNQCGIRMHREILCAIRGQEIDHIDGNGLNNQKSNLRFVTRRENLQNLHISKTSKFPGVYKKHISGNKQWSSQIKIDKKLIRLGVFKTEEEAHQKYMEAIPCQN